MTSQGRFSDYNNESTTLLGVVNKEGGWAWSAVVVLLIAQSSATPWTVACQTLLSIEFSK